MWWYHPGNYANPKQFRCGMFPNIDIFYVHHPHRFGPGVNTPGWYVNWFTAEEELYMCCHVIDDTLEGAKEHASHMNWL